jgi:transcriptional regulator with XRE-family HTH domain
MQTKFLKKRRKNMKPRQELWAAIRTANLTQDEFAKIVGDDPAVVSRIVTGQQEPTAVRKIRYAKALGKRVGELFTE